MLRRLFSDWMTGCFFEGDEGGGGSGAGGGSGEGAQGGGEPQVFSADYVRSLRGESANNRTRAKEAERKLAEMETAGKATAEQLKAAEEKAATAAARVVKSEVKVAAVAAGIIDPDAAYLFVKDAVKLNDAGDPENLKELLEALVKEKPYLVGQAGGNGGGGSTTNPGRERGGGGITKEAMRELARTNPDEFNRRWKAGEFKDVAL